MRVEIQGAFQEIVLPLIQKDLSSLKDDVKDMRRDLQQLSSGDSRGPSADVRRWSSNLLPAQDNVARNDSTDADAGRLSSRSGESWAIRALRKKSSKGIVGEQLLTLPNFIPESKDEDESPKSPEKDDAEVYPNGFTFIVPRPPPPGEAETSAGAAAQRGR